MKCRFCGSSETQVLESRVSEDGSEVRRRRECEKCTKRFTTYETVRDSVLWVVKKDGRREPFDREKLKRGILRAIEKRSVPLSEVDRLVGEVEREMLKKEKEEVPSRVVGNLVMKRLKRIDKVAWLRFASVYLEFKDLGDFGGMLEEK